MGSLKRRIDTTHTHLKESIIDPDTDESAAFSGGGGGGIDVTAPHLLGPYSIAFDTPGINGDTGDFLGAHLATLTEGDFILRAYTFVTSAWDGSQVLDVGIGNAAAAGDYGDWTLENLNLSASNEPQPGSPYFAEAVNNLGIPTHSAIVGPDCDLIAFIQDTTATQGTADIYLLVITPAA